MACFVKRLMHFVHLSADSIIKTIIVRFCLERSNVDSDQPSKIITLFENEVGLDLFNLQLYFNARRRVRLLN